MDFDPVLWPIPDRHLLMHSFGHLLLSLLTACLYISPLSLANLYGIRIGRHEAMTGTSTTHDIYGREPDVRGRIQRTNAGRRDEKNVGSKKEPGRAEQEVPTRGRFGKEGVV